jgi:ankyrin repeat protein
MVAAGGSMSAAEDGETENELMEAVQVALSRGNDINAVDDNGETAMHGAAYKDLLSEIKFLAEHGAKVEVWNRPNKKAIHAFGHRNKGRQYRRGRY